MWGLAEDKLCSLIVLENCSEQLPRRSLMVFFGVVIGSSFPGGHGVYFWCIFVDGPIMAQRNIL